MKIFHSSNDCYNMFSQNIGIELLFSLCCSYTWANVVTNAKNDRNLQFALQSKNDMIGQGKTDTLWVPARCLIILANLFYKWYKCLRMPANAIANHTMCWEWNKNTTRTVFLRKKQMSLPFRNKKITKLHLVMLQGKWFEKYTCKSYGSCALNAAFHLGLHCLQKDPLSN